MCVCSTNPGSSVGYVLCTRYVCTTLYDTRYVLCTRYVRIMYQIRMHHTCRCTINSTAVSLFVYSLVGGGITRTFRPWTHTSDDSYIYQLSLVVATNCIFKIVTYDATRYVIYLRSEYRRIHCTQHSSTSWRQSPDMSGVPRSS